MKSIFENLDSVGSEVTSKIINSSSDLRINVSLLMVKGVFNQEFMVYGTVTKMRYSGYYVIEDMERDVQLTRLGSIEVDDMCAFDQSLRGSGLSVLAEKLKFTDKEVDAALYKELDKGGHFDYFLKGMKSWSALSMKEQVIIGLSYAVENNQDIKKMFYNKEKELISDLMNMETITNDDILKAIDYLKDLE